MKISKEIGLLKGIMAQKERQKLSDIFDSDHSFIKYLSKDDYMLCHVSP